MKKIHFYLFYIFFLLIFVSLSLSMFITWYKYSFDKLFAKRKRRGPNTHNIARSENPGPEIIRTRLCKYIARNAVARLRGGRGR